jgi:hypothetical protein
VKRTKVGSSRAHLNPRRGKTRTSPNCMADVVRRSPRKRRSSHEMPYFTARSGQKTKCVPVFSVINIGRRVVRPVLSRVKGGDVHRNTESVKAPGPVMRSSSVDGRVANSSMLWFFAKWTADSVIRLQ